MEKEGVVSLWTGNTNSNEFLNDYTEMNYTEDGDRDPSEFIKDFNMYDIDEDFVEKERYEEASDNLEVLLSGCSYDDVVIPNIKKSVGKILKEKFNTIILVYNFEYSGDRISVDNGMYSFKYICTVEYS